MDFEKVDRILENHGHKHQALISIMHDIQAEENYLPRSVLEYVAKRMEVPFGRIYSIATFYKSFRLESGALHTIKVCYGTACYLKGAPRLLEKVEKSLKADEGKGASDSGFIVETTNCPGTCAKSPVMLIDGKEFGEVSLDEVGAMVKDCDKP